MILASIYIYYLTDVKPVNKSCTFRSASILLSRNIVKPSLCLNFEEFYLKRMNQLQNDVQTFFLYIAVCTVLFMNNLRKINVPLHFDKGPR